MFILENTQDKVLEYWKKTNSPYAEEYINLTRQFDSVADSIYKNRQKFQNAKYLKIDARKDDLKILELLPNLEFVTIYHIKEEDHEYLTLLKNVKVLELHPGYSASKVYLNLNYIKNNYIASINLYDFEIDSELLRKFIHLKELSLVWCKFSNLDFLRDLNNIEILFINTLVRIIGIISGTILAVKSGSRGQILFSIITIGIVYPISKPLKDIKNYIFVFLGLLFILLLVTTLSGFIAESGSYDMQKRWIEGGTDSGVGIRMANITFLLETYITSPAYWVQGLGFYSFAVLNPLNEPYTHAIIVDMIGEQGLIGAILFSGFIFFLAKSCYRFFQLVQYNAKLRENFSSIFAMLFYEILLANKQGNISGAFAFFGFSILIVSLYKNEMSMQINSSFISDE